MEKKLSVVKDEKLNIKELERQLGIPNDELNEGELGLGVLLGMPDDIFKQSAPLMEAEIEKFYNDRNNRELIRKAIIADNITVETLDENEAKAIDAIKKVDELSEIKKGFLTRVLTSYFNVLREELGSMAITIPIEIEDGVWVPEYANENDAGLDIRANEDMDIYPGETKLIRTGIKVAIPAGFELQVRPRSGLSLKTSIRIANAPGTVDASFRGELGIIVENNESPIKDIAFHYGETGRIYIDGILKGSVIHIEKGDRIAQLVLSKIYKANFTKIDNILEIEGNRGGGFGSTGVK